MASLHAADCYAPGAGPRLDGGGGAQFYCAFWWGEGEELANTVRAGATYFRNSLFNSHLDVYSTTAWSLQYVRYLL